MQIGTTNRKKNTTGSREKSAKNGLFTLPPPSSSEPIIYFISFLKERPNRSKGAPLRYSSRSFLFHAPRARPPASSNSCRYLLFISLCSTVRKNSLPNFFLGTFAARKNLFILASSPPSTLAPFLFPINLEKFDV